MPGILVGFDGSDNALRTLQWAMKEAAVHHAPLTVLAVHQVAANDFRGFTDFSSPGDRTAEETARQAAEKAVAAAARTHVADVKDRIGEVFIEYARLDIRAHLRCG